MVLTEPGLVESSDLSFTGIRQAGAVRTQSHFLHDIPKHAKTKE